MRRLLLLVLPVLASENNWFCDELGSLSLVANFTVTDLIGSVGNNLDDILWDRKFQELQFREILKIGPKLLQKGILVVFVKYSMRDKNGAIRFSSTYYRGFFRRSM